MKKIVYLSGGIGGAKLAKGFYNLKEIDLTIIINTGDDETIQGVRLSPDIDSVIYALAGIEGKYGWGQKNDSFVVSKEFKKYLPKEFSIGDKDPKNVKGIKIKNVKTNKIDEIKLDGVFIAIGHDPATQLFKNQLSLDKKVI